MLPYRFYNIFVIFNSSQKYCFLRFYIFLFNKCELMPFYFINFHNFYINSDKNILTQLCSKLRIYLYKYDIFLSFHIKKRSILSYTPFFLIRYHFCYLRSRDLIYSPVYIFFLKCIIYRFFIKSTAYQGRLYIFGIQCTEKIS